MKKINPVLIAILFLGVQAIPAFSYNNESSFTDIQLVGMPAPVDPDELKKQSPTADPEPEEYETDIPPDIAQDRPANPDGPVEYDPNNPYAEWER